MKSYRVRLGVSTSDEERMTELTVIPKDIFEIKDGEDNGMVDEFISSKHLRQVGNTFEIKVYQKK